MGKIRKAAGPKHEATISPALSEFLAKAADVPLIELPSHLDSFPRRWDFPRGDLYHWIKPLNRFDDILKEFIVLYALGDGPQTRPIGTSQLVGDVHDDDAYAKLRHLGFGDDGDKKLVESVLDFSRLLLEKCGNRSLYNSGERLNALLNTTNLSLLHSTLRLALCLAQRYHARHRPVHLNPGSLAAHYGLDPDRIQIMAAPVPIQQTSSKPSTPGSPEKFAKGRDKHVQSPPGADPNDLVSLSKDVTLENGTAEHQSSSPDHRARGGWEDCIRVQVVFQRENGNDANEGVPVKGTERTEQEASSVPSPLRRESTNQGSKLHRVSTSDDSGNGTVSATSSQAHATPSLKQKYEPPLSTLLSSPIGQVVQTGLSTVPKTSYYELLHKLRVAYALLGTVESRRELLAVRILAVSNLAYISSDSTFQLRFLTHDRERPKRQQIVYQLADLLHSGSRDMRQVPLQLQTHAGNALRAMTKQRSTMPDVNASLSIAANHGTLLFVLNKALEDVRSDGDTSDTTVGDEWRETLFSLLHALLLSGHLPRSGEVFASPQLVRAHIDLLSLRTQKAQRLYVEVLHFFDAFFHHVKDGLAVLANNKAFDAVIDLLTYQIEAARESFGRRDGFPAEYLTPAIDYRVQYTYQQTIRSIIPFINGVVAQPGAQADRILRSFIDSQDLLTALRVIVVGDILFGAHIWSEAVKVMTTFLNSEPTSYTIIAENGLSGTFLESIVDHPLPSVSDPQPPVLSSDSGSIAPTSQRPGSAAGMNQHQDSSQAGTKTEDISCIPQYNVRGILPAAEAIASIAQAFSAICLTSAGSEYFQASGALEKFFEIFESPAHVKVLMDESLQMLGHSFDEFVRHHPSLRPAVMSAIIVMVSRVRWLCKWKAWAIGAGTKLWSESAEGDLQVAGGTDALVRETILPTQDSSNLSDESLYLQLPSGKRLLATTKVTESLPDMFCSHETDQEGLSVSDYLDPVTSFLLGLFENPSLCTAFMDAGGAELILDLPTLQSLPYDFYQSLYDRPLSRTLAQVIHMMAETKPHLILPVLVDRILMVSKNLEPFVAHQLNSVTCFVDPLVTTSDQPRDETTGIRPEDGTFFAKSLVALQLLVNILSQVYSSPMYHARNREQPAPFFQVNLADKYREVCQKLGALSAACHREGRALEKRAPQQWTDPVPPNEPFTEAENNFPETRHAEDTAESPRPEAAVSPPRGRFKAQRRTSGMAFDVESHEKTAAFKNLRIIRRLFSLLPQSITRLFSQLGHGLVGRKRLDTYQKQNSLSVGGAIAGALVYQLDPPFFKDDGAGSPGGRADLGFSYFAEVLKSCCNALFDFGTSPDHAHCLTAVVLPFKAQGGVQALRRLGERFHNELGSGQVSSETAETTAMANAGLKSVMSILEHLTSAKSVIDSTQSNSFKILERSKPHHFNPAQFLLELRLEALPFVRTIWASPYAEQASRLVLEKLIAILRHILNGDQEHEADKDSDKSTVASSSPPKKFVQSAEKLNTLKSKGYEEDLAREALFRCNNHPSAAEEYCKMFVRNPKLTRHPLPSAEVESPVPVTSRTPTPDVGPSNATEPTGPANPAAGLASTLGDLGAGQSLLDLLGNFQHAELPTPEIVTDPTAQSSTQGNVEDDEMNRMEGVENAEAETDEGSHRDSGLVMESTAIEGDADQEPKATVKSMDLQREQLRSDLAERCLNIISSHYDVTWELSELVKSATTKLQGPELSTFRESACSLLVTSLVSLLSDLEADDFSEATRQKIPACAHFVALLIQDKYFYEECLPHLQDSFDSLLRFFRVPSKEPPTDASLPWMGQVLLIIERMLSDDAEPTQVTWNMPTSIDSAPPEAATATEKTTITKDEKVSLFESLLDVLPRVNKDKSLALSIARVLTILTRERHIAAELGEKRNLQRLFVMMKQLANMANDRIHSAIMLTLRHIIEDSNTLRQIMSSQIIATFEGLSSRQIDTTTYVRSLYHLVLRSPEMFVQVTNDRLKLQQFDTNQKPQTLILKAESPVSDVSKVPTEQQGSSSSEPAPTGAVPKTKDTVGNPTGQSTYEDSKAKTGDIKPPIVEHPDGVIHFILSQLLSYKDVDDKEISPASTDKQVTSPTDATHEAEMGDASGVSTPGTEAPLPEKVEKPQFMAEDHPIYVYRCFLLQCLTELLHSYNRTKIEFINFSRKSDPSATTPSKPRSGVLNYLLNSLIPQEQIESEDSIHFKKRSVTSDWAMKVIIALCSKTGEQGLGIRRERYASYPRVEDNDSEPDLTFVRRFVLEHSVKAYKDAASSNEPLQARYARMLSLANLFHQMLSKSPSTEGGAGSDNTSHKVLAKMMFEKNFISVLTSSLAEIDLTFPGAKRVVKYILKPLHELTDTAVYLSLNSSSPVSSALGQSEEDDISSASSVSEAEDEREETPDLFRNSALGMLEPNREDNSTSDSEGEEDEDEMYAADYADDMDFDEEVGPVPGNDGEVVSDEDVDDESGPGEIEGLQGDVPMDIEFVMNDPHMGIETDDDEDDDEDDDDGEEHDDDEDGDEDDGEDEDDDEEDFLVDVDDVIEAGEINADGENDSLAEGGGEWLSADDPEHDLDDGESPDDMGEIINQASTAMGDANTANVSMGGQGSLNNLLNILGENSGATRPPGMEIGELLGDGDIEHAMQDLQDEDEDDGNEDDMDENEDDLAYQTFNEILNDSDTPWPWEESGVTHLQRSHHRPPPHHHPHFRAAPGQLTSLMNRHLTGHSLLMPPAIHRSHRVAPPARTMEDGTNPLLQHPSSSAPTSSHQTPSPMDFAHGFGPGFMGYLPTGQMPQLGSGSMVDAIMEAVQRGDGRVEMIDPSGRVDIHVDTNPPRFTDMLIRPSFPPPSSRNTREDPQRTVVFNPLSTACRWQEEARILFGMSHLEKTQRVVITLLSVLVPPAIEEERTRRKKAEEDRKLEEEKQAELERREQQEIEERDRKKRQEEEEEAEKEKAAPDVQAEAEQATSSVAIPAPQQVNIAPIADSEEMHDVRGSDPQASVSSPEEVVNQPSAAAGPSENPVQRTFTTIRGRQLDITNMSIDAEYLEALPEELREEVIMQQYAEQRHQAEEQGQPPTDINREFLEALPEEIREELLQQEATERRRRERDAARRRSVGPGGPPRAEEMDADSFMATLDPALRRSILADQSDEVLNALAPEYAAEARAIMNRQMHHFGGRMPLGRDAREDRATRDATSGPKEQRKQIVQMVDRAGVATLMRLMFMQQQGSASNNLHTILHNVCQHRQTRAEVISLLLSILQDGSADVSAVEKSLAHLSLRAKTSPAQKLPQPLKRTFSSQAANAMATEMTPLMVVQQCLAALASLTHYDAHVASVFLRELETSAGNKSRIGRKGKSKEIRANKFAINALIGLLDRKLITENSACMESLSNLLATITQPLTWLLKEKDKPGPSEVEKQDEVPTPVNGDAGNDRDATSAAVESSELPQPQDQTNGATDTPMADVPSDPTTSGIGSDSAAVERSEGTSKLTKSGDEPQASDESKSKKAFDPPTIPEQNFRLIVGVLAARECNGKTFRDTLSTINALSLISGAKDVFGQELVGQSKNLSRAIFADLNDLLGNISEASSGTDVQGLATAKFSPASADQAKLLRVLTALDYLFDPKRADNSDETSPRIQDVLSSLYETSNFAALWTKLSECLSAIHQRDGMLSVATVLLPLIEALMVVCKNASLKDAPISARPREQPTSSPAPETGMEGLFFTFTTEHRKILNELVRQNSKLMNGSFSLLAKNPKVLEFDNKRTYFTRQIHSKNREARPPQAPLQLSVRRDQVFLDSFKSLYFKSAEEMKFGKLSIRFHGEEGVDAGGVTREWFQVLARGMFNPNYALFIPVASDRTTFHPNRLSGVNSEHLMFFKFIGRIIGKALYEGRVLDCHFSRAVYKKILGKTVSLKDMETLDLDYYKSLVWMLENDITDIITETFSIETNDFGEPQTIDLIENGRNIPVTEENKQEYIQLVVEYRLTGSVKEQLENFLKGFHDIVPAELVSIFTEQELELLISGLPDINLDDWKANTEYHTYSASSPAIQWFWRAVRSFDKEEQAKLLQFVTGTSKVPLNGFKELEGMNGFSRFNIHKDYGSSDRLPSSHTCFNQLDLPAYENYETLRQRLLTAMLQGSEYFGFA